MELLAPAGSFECAKAAVSAGADAIYMGGPLFSARAYAESSIDGGNNEIKQGDPETDPLMKSIKFCHLHNVKVYMTVNTLMKDREMEDIASYLRPYVDLHVDAFIVQDLGLLSELKKSFPDIPIHMSTQAAVTGRRYAGRLLEMGVSRVVPARELSLKELKEIADTGIEVEAFIHGALCYSYSGQCLMSSFLGGRSGNRGRCAGPCRLPYEVYDENLRRMGLPEEQYVLSMKDLCTLPRLSELEEAGVCSLKIEGRMKSPVYVAGVTSIYRKWLDGKYDGATMENDLAGLRGIFDRGGFTDKYLDSHNGRDMITLYEKEERKPSEMEIAEEIKERFVGNDEKKKITVSAFISIGNAAMLTLKTDDGRYSVTVSGPVVSEASKRPITKEDVKDKIMAFGNTSFEPVGEDIYVEEGAFLPVSALKELRRNAADELEKRILESFG
ncbi:MAG: U32 family peptidase [Lachnospiraceae bacterium]|nr:U32 family peptidase [Lachnospiraceae bacterium]